MENTLQAAVLLRQFSQVYVKCLFNAHYIKIAAFCHWWLYDPTVTEIPFSDVVNVATALPAFQCLLTTRIPVMSQICTQCMLIVAQNSTGLYSKI